MTCGGRVHQSRQDKAGASKSAKGYVLADMVDMLGLVGRTRRQAMFA